MVVKVYGLVWFFVLAGAGVLYFTGSFNEMTLPIIGFVFSTLAVMGFVAVLPSLLDDHFSPKTYPTAFSKPRAENR
ncbi:MAG TPA: hypothetical protein VK468_02640 [Pyrinomonadaceae bacterium]|nr:hypothetical protein [Pyrinomonadaceae bacterium]